MSQQQERITDSLTSVIQIIQTGHGTGELRVWRESGPNAEVGSFVFINGRIVAAHVGLMQGVEAFNTLKTWGRAMFIFTPGTPPPLQQNSPVLEPQEKKPSTTRPLPTTDPQTPVSEPPQKSTVHLTAVPRATMSIVKAVGIIEKMGLARTYRQLILFIDGQRPVSELALAMNCTPQDMWQMLQELEKLTIIRISR